MTNRVVIKPVRAAHFAPRAGAVLLFSGALLTLVGVLIPPAAEHSDPALVVFAGIAIAVGAALWVKKPTSERTLGAAVLLGTVFISFVMFEAGDSGSADDVEITYLWTCLFGFYFFRLRHALAQLGAVAVGYGIVVAAYSPPDVAMSRWITTIGTLLVGGLVIAILRNSLEESVEELALQARRDPLTGALNRSALVERASVEFARARREVRPTSVIEVDVDRFKLLNDTRGHPAGDELLRRVAETLASETRPTDAVARVGGDEFAVLLPGTGAEEAERIAERLLAAADHRLSIGVATTAAPPRIDFDQLWAAADGAMYEAKRAGGDSVRQAPGVAPAAS